MAAFGADGRCLMRALQEELDDPEPRDCGRCAVCAGPRFDGAARPRARARGGAALRSRPLVLEVKKMAPGEDGAMRKLPEDVRAEEGRALARLGDGGWDPLVRRGRRAGRFDDELVEAAAEVVRGWRAPVAWVAAVPSRRSGALVPDFAARLAARARPPVPRRWSAPGDRPPQREMANSAQQVANVRGPFAVARRPAAGPVPAGRRRALQRLDARHGRRASCAAAAPQPSIRSRWPRRSERRARRAPQDHRRDLVGVVAHRDVAAAAQPHVLRARSRSRARRACVGSSSASRVPQAIVAGTGRSPAKS